MCLLRPTIGIVVDRLKSKVALVTGAARGMGEAEATLFVAEGAKVVLTDVNVEAGAALAERLGPNALFRKHDVSSESDWERVFSVVQERFGGLDILVNNAGLFRGGELISTDLTTYQQLVQVNQVGAFLGIRGGAAAMMKRGTGGSIVNISSIAGLRGTSGMFAYASSKWAVRGMSRAAAAELARHQIRVNSVHPGLTSTDMLDDMAPEGLALLKARVPMGRLGTVAEVANLVLFLASDESAYITGAEVQIDGGNLA